MTENIPMAIIVFFIFLILGIIMLLKRGTIGYHYDIAGNKQDTTTAICGFVFIVFAIAILYFILW